MALTGERSGNVALGVDDHQCGPGPGGVILPGDQLRVIQDRVLDLVALHRSGQRVGVSLMLKLRRVHAHGDQHIVETLLQRTQFVQHMEAVDAAEGPEIENDDFAAQILEGDLLTSGVQPASADQLGGPHTCAALDSLSHTFPQRVIVFSCSAGSLQQTSGCSLPARRPRCGQPHGPGACSLGCRLWTTAPQR